MSKKGPVTYFILFSIFLSFLFTTALYWLFAGFGSSASSLLFNDILRNDIQRVLTISIRHCLGLSFCILLFARIKINIYLKICPSLLPSIYFLLSYPSPSPAKSRLENPVRRPLEVRVRRIASKERCTVRTFLQIGESRIQWTGFPFLHCGALFE